MSQGQTFLGKCQPDMFRIYHVFTSKGQYDYYHQHKFKRNKHGLKKYQNFEVALKSSNNLVHLYWDGDTFKSNKPSFCLDSCDEIHARRKFQNKTSLKYLNLLETHLTQNTLETSLKAFETALKLT